MQMLVLYGRCDEAHKLLMTYSQRDDSAIKSIDELLRKIPLNALNEDNLAEFTEWQQEVQRRLDDGQFVSYPQVETIAKVKISFELQSNRCDFISIQLYSSDFRY